MLGWFHNTLTANDNDLVQDCEKLSSPTQTHLSLEPKFFSDLFIPFLESTSNYKHFEKINVRQTYFFSEITECERLD